MEIPLCYLAKWIIRLLCLLLVASISTVVHSQILREDVALYDKPDGAQTSTKAKAGTAVKLQKRQGFWVEVEVGGKTGWLKVSKVALGSVSSGPTAIDTGRLGTGNIVATSSARGMSAKDLLAGKPNFQEADKLDLLIGDASGIQAFRTQGGVQPALEKISLAAPSVNSTSAASAQPSANAANTTNKKKSDDDW